MAQKFRGRSVETDMHTMSSGMDPIERQEELGETSVVIVPVLVQYSTSLSMSLFPQLQLWLLHCSCLNSRWATCIYKCSRFTLSVLRKHVITWMTPSMIMWKFIASVPTWLWNALRVNSMSQYPACVFSCHSITLSPTLHSYVSWEHLEMCSIIATKNTTVANWTSHVTFSTHV